MCLSLSIIIVIKFLNICLFKVFNAKMLNVFTVFNVYQVHVLDKNLNGTHKGPDKEYMLPGALCKINQLYDLLSRSILVLKDMLTILIISYILPFMWGN